MPFFGSFDILHIGVAADHLLKVRIVIYTKDLITTRLDTSAKKYVIVSPARSSCELVYPVYVVVVLRRPTCFTTCVKVRRFSIITDFIRPALVYSKPERNAKEIKGTVVR